MARRTLIFLGMIVGLFLFLSSLSPALAGDRAPLIPDKALCAKMLRFGKEAYQRGKYLDAKEYFRKAVQADPGSSVAWRYYDQAVIFALAEKAEQRSDLLSPGVSTRSVAPGAAASAPPPTALPPKKETGFKIVDDEGC